MGLLDYAKSKKKALIGAWNNDASTLGIAKNTVKGIADGSALRDAKEFNLGANSKTGIGRVGGAIASGLLNPFIHVKDYAQEAADQYYGNKEYNLKTLAGKGGQAALDLGGLYGGSTAAKSLYNTGKGWVSGQIPKLSTSLAQGAKKGIVSGGLYGAGYGASQAASQNKSGRDIANDALYGGATGALFGGALGGGLPAIGALPRTIKNSLANRKPGAITRETLPAHWQRSGIMTRTGDAAFPQVLPGNRMTGKPFRAGFDEVQQSPITGIRTEKFIPEQVVERGRRTPTLRDLGMEVRDALPRPGMSIQAVDDPLLSEAKKYSTPEEFVKGAKDSIKKVPLTGNSRKYLSELFQVGDSNIYIGYKKTGKVSSVARDVVDGSGKSTGKMRSETPEIDFRVFQKEDGFSAENAFIKAQRGGENGGITTLDELPKSLKSQLTDLYNQAIAPQPKSSPIGKDVRPEAPQVGKTADLSANTKFGDITEARAVANLLQDSVTIDDATKVALKNAKDSEILQILRDANVPANTYGSLMFDMKDASRALEKLKNGQVLSPSESAMLLKSGALPETPKVAPQVGKTDPLEALKAEARKYKSAEEFVKSQIKRDLVSEVKPVKVEATDRTMFTTASARAKSNTLTDKLVDAAKRNQKQFDRDIQKSIPQLQKEIDDLRMFAEKEGASEGSLGIALKEEIIQTKSQLTDLWNEAQGGKTLKDLGKEVLDALPRPGMSIDDIATPIRNQRKMALDEIIRAEADAMLDMKNQAQGPVMLNTGYDYLPGAGEFQRVSDNPKWYREYFSEYGHAPSKKEMLRLAEDALKNGEGYFQKEFNQANEKFNSPITMEDINSIINDTQTMTKSDILRMSKGARIFKNREYPQPEIQPGTMVSPSRTLPAPVQPLLLGAGKFTASSKSEAKNLFNKYGRAPELKTESKINRPIFVSSTGEASFSRNKAEQAGIETGLNNEDFKDISTLNKGWQDVYRNFRKFFGGRSKEYTDKYLRPFEQGKDTMYRNLDQHANELERDIVKGLGIKRESAESAAVQEFGEGLRDKSSLIKEFGKTKAGNIIKADHWFRAKYDKLLSEVNKAREYVYPNNPEKQIQRRGDYYRHFRELQDGFGGLMNIFETPAGIDNSLAGISNTTKPQSKWLSFAQKRLGAKTDVDAVGGYINYLGAAEYAKNVDPHINGIRKLADAIAETGNRNGKDYNNFIQFLSRWADDLSGKTNALDRGIQEFTGRTAFRAVDWLNRRVKANTILGNASSSLAQVFALPAGISSAGEGSFIKGVGRLIRSTNDDTSAMAQSPFIRERYFNSLDRFDEGLFNNTKKFAAWMVTALDEMSTKAIWNAHFEKALSGKIPNPVQYADDATRNIVAGRGVGEMPLIQRSRAIQLAIPFQLEVANSWPVMKELAGENAGKLAKLFVYTYILNQGVKEIRGSDVAFDPINAAVEGYQQSKEEDTVGGKARAIGGRMAGEVLSNLPFGQTAAAMYPEYGAKDILGTGVNLPTREKLFGKGDPTRFGGGLLVAKAFQDPLYKILPPFGGVQLERTINGIKDYAKGYSEKAGKVMYPVEQNLRNFAQSSLFGTRATPEGQDYTTNERSPLGDVQSEKFKAAGDRRSFYDSVINNRESDKEKEKLRGGAKIESGEIGEGMTRLSNGKIYVPSLDKEFETPAKAQKAIALDNFLNSDQQSTEIDGRYYYKDDSVESGYRSKNVSERSVDISEKKLTQLDMQEDVEGWMKEADSLYKQYWKVLQNENLDEEKRIETENAMQRLAEKYNKVKEYNGFTKPKKAKKVSIKNPIDDPDFIVKKATSRLRPLRAFSSRRSDLASVRRPSITRKKLRAYA